MLEKHLHHSSGLWLAIVQGVVFHLWSDSVTAVPSTIPPLHALTYSHTTTRTHKHTHIHTCRQNHLNTVLHKHVQISSNGCSNENSDMDPDPQHSKTGYFRNDMICQVAHLQLDPAKLPCEIQSNAGLPESNEWHPYAPICWMQQMHFT